MSVRVKRVANRRRSLRDRPACKQKKSPLAFLQAGLLLFKNPAIPTFALVGTIIGSESLTTVFGMGTGVPFGYGHREESRRAVALRDPLGL